MRVQSRRLAIATSPCYRCRPTAAGPPARGTPRWCNATLATVPLDAAPDVITAMARMQGRIVGATEPEIESAVSVAAAVLAHPLLSAAREAAQAGRLLRETPVATTVEGELVEGVVDLAFGRRGLGHCDRLQTIASWKGRWIRTDGRSRSTRTPSPWPRGARRAGAYEDLAGSWQRAAGSADQRYLLPAARCPLPAAY